MSDDVIAPRPPVAEQDEPERAPEARRAPARPSSPGNSAKPGGNRTRAMSRYGVRPAAGDDVQVQRKADEGHRVTSLAEWATRDAPTMDPFGLHLVDAPPVQLRAEGDRATSDADLPRHAAAGVQGGGQTLPCLDELETSFGRHGDGLDAVRVHTDAAASNAASAIGAQAYATGNDIALAGPA